MSLVSQTIAQLAPRKTLEQEIMDILIHAKEAMSARQIHEAIDYPPDRETLTKELLRIKMAGAIVHDPEAIPPPGSRGNVGMYRIRKADDPPAPQPDIDPPRKDKKPVSKQAVADAIFQAGADGITQTHLRTMFIGHPSEVYSVVQSLFVSGKIVKPSRGHLVDALFANAPPRKIISERPFGEALQELKDAATETKSSCVSQTAESERQPTLTATGDKQIDMTPGADERLLPGGELAVPSREQVADLASMIEAIPNIVEDVILADPERVEFAIYSSGGLDIYYEDCSITMNKLVLAKLRAFLGLFREESA